MPRDEDYIIDLCDSVLNEKAIRQHRFDFLCGDTGRKLPVDAYYPNMKLVVEYRERQHFESVALWNRATVSGIPRDQQRAIYDQRRRDLLPKHGINLLELCCTDFECNRAKRLLRSEHKDLAVIRSALSRHEMLSIS